MEYQMLGYFAKLTLCVCQIHIAKLPGLTLPSCQLHIAILPNYQVHCPNELQAVHNFLSFCVVQGLNVFFKSAHTFAQEKQIALPQPPIFSTCCLGLPPLSPSFFLSSF
jgi:hypothetical protein